MDVKSECSVVLQSPETLIWEELLVVHAFDACNGHRRFDRQRSGSSYAGSKSRRHAHLGELRSSAHERGDHRSIDITALDDVPIVMYVSEYLWIAVLAEAALLSLSA